MTEILEQSSTTNTEAQILQNQTFNLRLALEKDIAACDIKWSLFVAAAQSYRYHSRLNPYPPKYATKEKSEYDIDRIRLTISNVPPLHQLLRQIKNEESSEDVVDLVHWVICSKSFPILRSVPKDEVVCPINEILMELLNTFLNNFSSIQH